MLLIQLITILSSFCTESKNTVGDRCGSELTKKNTCGPHVDSVCVEGGADNQLGGPVVSGADVGDVCFGFS